MLTKDTLFIVPIRNEKIVVRESASGTNGKSDRVVLKYLSMNTEHASNKILTSEMGPSSSSHIRFNELIPNPESLLPNKKGYQPSTVTNIIEGICPDFNVTDDYVKLDFVIRDKGIYDKSGIIFVSMTGIDKDGQHYFIYNEYYKPQFGYNHLRIRNTSKSGKYVFTYGIIFKSDMEKEFPYVNGFNCHFGA